MTTVVSKVIALDLKTAKDIAEFQSVQLAVTGFKLVSCKFGFKYWFFGPVICKMKHSKDA